MKENVKKLLSAILLAVFLISSAQLLMHWFDKQKSDTSNSNAEQLAHAPQLSIAQDTAVPETLPSVPATEVPETAEPPKEVWSPAPVEDDDPHMESLELIDLAALRLVNEDVVGWILIPNTNINFPLTQTEDNTFYLDHSWDGTSNIYGAIFLECTNDPNMTDFNTIIYGHNMNDDSMFASLHDYANQVYWQAHPYLYIVTDSGVFRYEIFSTYLADVESKTYGLSFNQEKTRVEFIQMALENSEIDTGITPATTDRIITLSTCTGRGYGSRRVVHARLKMVLSYEA